MTIRWIPSRGRLAALGLLLGAAGLPPVAWAQDDGLRYPQMPRAYAFEENHSGEGGAPADGEDPGKPLPATGSYQISSLSDGGRGELVLGTSGSRALRLQATSAEPLPPVSVESGPFQFQVNTSGALRRKSVSPGTRHRPRAAGGGKAPRASPPRPPDGTARAKEPPRHRPRVLLTGLHVSQGGQTPGGLTFSFSGIDPVARSLKFHYRLGGLEPDWRETGRRSVSYPDLQPGPYRFEVRAVNGAGLWSEPAGLSFTILPPWWRQPLRVIELAALGIALAGGLLAVRARRLLQLERLRASIAADLHDQMGAGLTDIAILSEVAARKAGDLPELTRVAATARELVDGMGDIVWLVNPRRDSLYELFLRLKDSYDELFAHAGAQLEVADLTPLEGARLPLAFRQDLHLLFKEALRNALRHSGCRRAELSVTLRGRHLEAVLRDDGRGFDPEDRNGNGEGLEAMRLRAGRLGGRLTIDSSPAGTTVRFAGSIS